MIKHDWCSKVVVRNVKVRQFFTVSGLSKKVENLVAARDSKHAAWKGAAGEAVVGEEIIDMLEEMANTYDEEFFVVGKKMP